MQVWSTAAKQSPVYCEMEKEVRLFGETKKPDYQIMRLNNDKEEDMPLFVIEVKLTDGN